LKNFATPTRLLIHEERKAGIKIAQERMQSFSSTPRSENSISRKRTSSVLNLSLPRNTHRIREETCDLFVFSDILLVLVNRFPKDVIRFVPLKPGVVDLKHKRTAHGVTITTIDLKIIITVAGDDNDDNVTTLLMPSEKHKERIETILRQRIE
jgi:hypothetical protein